MMLAHYRKKPIYEFLKSIAQHAPEIGETACRADALHRFHPPLLLGLTYFRGSWSGRMSE